MQARGIFLTVLSAVLYGLNPLFSKTINVGGCNSLTQTFARLAAGIVIFFILLVCSGSGSVREKLRLSRQELKDILICCIGYGLIGPLLFASYNYLASGLATTLHFVYPVLVVVAWHRLPLRKGEPPQARLLRAVLCRHPVLLHPRRRCERLRRIPRARLGRGVGILHRASQLQRAGDDGAVQARLLAVRLFRRARRRHHARDGRIRLALHRLHARRRSRSTAVCPPRRRCCSSSATASSARRARPCSQPSSRSRAWSSASSSTTRC